MTSPRPQYVSPSLRPTSPWAQQTSTGTFRPPPPFNLGESRQKKIETPKQISDQSRGWETSAMDEFRGSNAGYATMEQIMEMIAREIRSDRELFEGHQVTNRELDKLLRRAQDERKTLQIRADSLQGEVRALCEHLQHQKDVIGDIVKSLQ